MIQIVCTNCKKSFNLNPIEVASATVEGMLTHTYTFACDHCRTPNKLTKAEFETAKEASEGGAKPAAAMPAAKPAIAPARPALKPTVAAHGRDDDADHAAPGMAKKAGTVLVASLHVRKDHSTSAETVRGLVKGDEVTITTTWTDGTNTWAQIGENEWAAVEHGGKKMIELN